MKRCWIVPALVKKLWWNSTYGMISVTESLFRKGKRSIRSFSASAEVRCRGYSLRLQRAVVDFASDVPYEKAVLKVQEHYGVELCARSIRRVTMCHAQQMHEEMKHRSPERSSEGVETVIAAMDGCMVPIVESDEGSKDRRKNKELYWKELKLCLAHEAGSKRVEYGGTFSGGVQEAGKQLYGCAVATGFGTGTQVHVVGDGAKWIAEAVEDQFGRQGRYLIDLYHLCGYLAGAVPEESGSVKSWVDRQKSHLKEGRAKQVIHDLRARVEPPQASNDESPVRRCYRYMSNRKEQFHYKEAIEKGLPVGSGEVESAHRYVVQNRLKLPGAWWSAENVDKMLALRLTRANQRWNGYWDKQSNKNHCDEQIKMAA